MQDHINFTLGRQSFNLRLLEDAQTFFRQLLEYESLQAPEQQASYLREFLFVFKVFYSARFWTISSVFLHDYVYYYLLICMIVILSEGTINLANIHCVQMKYERSSN